MGTAAEPASPPGRRVHVNVALDVPLVKIAEQLNVAGLTVDTELDLLGVVTGDIAEEAIPELAGIAGVAAVEIDRSVEAFDGDDIPATPSAHPTAFDTGTAPTKESALPGPAGSGPAHPTGKRSPRKRSTTTRSTRKPPGA